MPTMRMRPRFVLLAVLACAPLAASLPACSKSNGAAPVTRQCTIDALDATDWHLRADGTLLRDAHDRVIALRGVDGGGRSKLTPYAPFDFTDGTYDSALASYMDRAASWGIDAMRVPFTWAAVEPTQGTDDEAFLKRYDAFIDAAWARGIYSVVDFHQDVYATIFCGDGFPLWTIPDPKPAPLTGCTNNWGLEYFGNAGVRAAFDALWAKDSKVMTAMLAMWDRMSARYKDRPGVIGFELINEPGWGTADFTQFEATTLSDFYATAIPHFRAAAPSTLFFIDPTGFAGTIATTPLKRPPGDGIVFAPHFYPLVGNTQGVIDGLQKWSDIATTWNTPLFIGEFGTTHGRGDALPFASAHFDAFDALGIHGTEWEYSVANEGWNDETFSLVAGDGTEFPVAQAVIRPFAKAIAGSAVTSAFDTTARSFTLAYVPAATTNVSEIALPDRAYPNGYDVALSGGCVDRSKPGRLLVKADDGAANVELTVTTR